MKLDVWFPTIIGSTVCPFIDKIQDKYKNIRSIGKAIVKTRVKYEDRFAIRFSNAINEEFSANSEELTDKGITCLAQVKESVSCVDCTLCWASKKSVRFLTH